MIEIKYGGFYQEVSSRSCSIAEVRQQLKEEIDLPDRVKARLNGKWVDKEQELETILCDEDELCFEERGRKGLILLGALLFTLILTGGLFAYTQTTQVTTITVTDGGVEYAYITANTTDNSSYTITGKKRGVIDEGSLFDITADPSYTGDLVVSVFLNNVDQMQNDYSNWILRLRLTNSTNTSVDTQGSLEVITLDNAMVSFEVQSTNITAEGGQTVYVHIDGGSYKAYSAGWLSGVNPSIYAQITQAGSH